MPVDTVKKSYESGNFTCETPAIRQVEPASSRLVKTKLKFLWYFNKLSFMDTPFSSFTWQD